MIRPGQFLVLSFILLCCLAGNAQRWDYDNFLVKDGLPQNFIYCISQDSTGYLWAGTGKGLVRYSGSSFKTYTTADGLAEDFVSALYRDNQNRLWIGHYKGGVTLFDGEKFTTIVPTDSLSRIHSITQTGDYILLGTQQHGIHYYSRGEMGVLKSEILADQRVNTMYLDKTLHLLVGTTQGWCALRFDQTKRTLQTVVDSLSTMEVVAIAGDIRKYYLATRQDGLKVLNKQFKDQISIKLVKNELEQGMYPTSFLTGPGGVLWLGTTKGMYSVGDSTVTAIDRFPTWTVNTSYVDRSGNHWLGTAGKGLIMLPYSFTTRMEIKGTVKVLKLGVAGEYWLGTSKGLFKLVTADNSFSNSNTPKQVALPGNKEYIVTAIHRDNEGSLWLGTDSNGIFKQENGATEWKSIAWDKLIATGINHLTSDVKGNIWVSTSTEGVFILDNTGKQVDQLTTKNGLLHNNITEVYHDRHKVSWFITQGTGLACKTDSGFVYLDNKDGLSGKDLTGIIETQDGSIWIGTSGQGMFRFKNGVFSNYKKSRGLLSDYAYSIIQGKQNQFWVVSRNGIAEYDPNSDSFQTFYIFREEEQKKFKANMAIWMRDETIVVAGYNGLMTLRTDREVSKTFPSPLINDINVSGKSIPSDQKLNLEYGRYRIKFGFDAIKPSGIKDPLFQYRLNGYEPEWSNISTENFAYYTNLPSGTYELQVRCGISRFSLSPIANYSFTISKPIWKQSWFIILSIALTILLIYGIILARTISLKRANKKLEKKVSERTEKIRKQNEEIQHFTYSITHDLKTPVMNITGLIKMLIASGIPQDEHRKAILERLTGTSEHLQNNLEGLMQVIKAREAPESNKNEVIFFDQLIKELKSNTHTLIEESQATISTDFEVPSTVHNREHLYSYFYNLLTNAMKYRSPERPLIIDIIVKKEGEFIKISVQDNGLGINLEKDREKLFGMFQRIHDHASGSGIGLHLVKKIIETTGGKLEVESELNKGSTFFIYLPSHNN